MRHEVVQLPRGTMATAHSTMTASTMLVGLVCDQLVQQVAAPVSPMKGATIDRPSTA